MPENRLNIVSIAADQETFSASKSHRNAKIKALQAKFERLWLLNPKKFNPFRNCLEKERLERTWQLLNLYTDPKEMLAADIGCGMGIFSERLQEAGAAHVTAVDIAENALKRIIEKHHPKITLKWGAMPDTSLPDQGFDIVICTELIAEIPMEEYRLFFAELARIIRPDGWLVFSSNIDIDSEEAVDKLVKLAQTEFDLVEGVKSYHALYIRLKRVLEAPNAFAEGWTNKNFRQKELGKRKGLNRTWYWLNTTLLCGRFWYAIKPIANFFTKHFNSNRSLLLGLEKLCRFFWDEKGISHYLFIAKLRPLLSTQAKDIPLARPGKKEVWE